MPNLPIPEEPKIITTIGQWQKVFASVAVSMFATVWLTGLSIFSDIFKPDYINVLTSFRMGLALVGATFTSIVGYFQIIRMVKWLIDGVETYRKLIALKKEQDDQKPVA